MYFNLEDKEELERFVQRSPEGTVSLVDMDEDPSKNIYRLNDKILIKEFYWDPDKV